MRNGKQVEELTTKTYELLPFDCKEVCQPPAREVSPSVTSGKLKQIPILFDYRLTSPQLSDNIIGFSGFSGKSEHKFSSRC